MRGSQNAALILVCLCGSIPACAGEPGLPEGWQDLDRVYPRVCGGASFALVKALSKTGLSPRVRGSRKSSILRLHEKRSIPACAGEPLSDGSLRVPSKVYPRVCGGAILTRKITMIAMGLSPRVRGSLPMTPLPWARSRSIPACAGEPLATLAHTITNPVYPRVCGGAARWYGIANSITGLSPRVRGSQGVPHIPHRCSRSIPACAGEPRSETRMVRGLPVYPRVCGGAAVFGSYAAMDRGLSPRVRGSQCRILGAVIVIGSIPACAGEPPLRA